MRDFSRWLLWLPWLALAILAVYILVDLGLTSVQEVREGLPWIGVVFNFVLRLIPNAILVFALGLMIEVLKEEHERGHMQRRVQRLLYWTPRAGVLTFVFLVSLFALDVFGQGYGFRETILALLIHLLPVGVMLLAIAIAWRREWMGMIFFTAWGVWYLVAARGFAPSVYLIMAGLPLALGLLFLLNWQYRRELRQWNQPG
jgi:hypothetical protein